MSAVSGNCNFDSFIENALGWLPSTLVPLEQRYASHFMQLLYYERTAELQTKFAEAIERVEQLPSSQQVIWTGAWDWISPDVNQPEIRLQAANSQHFRIPRYWGVLHNGDKVLLFPVPKRQGIVTFAEVRKELIENDVITAL